MFKLNKRIKLSILIVILITVITVIGTSFAYFASANGNNNIGGQSFDFGASLNSSTIYSATNLVPLSNSLITTAISKASNKCIDLKNNDVCSLYQITLSNNGDDVVLYPFITTTSTTYTTNNLKAQLFNSSFVAVSDILTPSNSANGEVYFTSNSNNMSINLSSSNIVYYLAIWLSDTSASQTVDYNKSYSGKITFSAGDAGSVYTTFGS